MVKDDSDYVKAATAVAWNKSWRYILKFPIAAFFNGDINSATTYSERANNLIDLKSGNIKWHEFRDAVIAWCKANRRIDDRES